VLHFAFPFFFLLSRSVKRNPHRLISVAVLILIMRVIDLIWLIEPNFHEHFILAGWTSRRRLLWWYWVGMFARECRSGR